MKLVTTRGDDDNSKFVTTAAGLYAECSQSECSMSVRAYGLVVVSRPPASHSQHGLFIVVTDTTTTIPLFAPLSQSSSLRRRGYAVCAIKKSSGSSQSILIKSSNVAEKPRDVRNVTSHKKPYQQVSVDATPPQCTLLPL